MLDLRTPAPAFTLQDVADNSTVSLADFAGRPLLAIFLSRHCPYVKHLQDKLAELANSWQAQGIGVVAISANDAEQYPEDAPEKLAEQKREVGFEFPYLFDETQAVAKAYTAACTPDFFLFDKDHKLVYRGRFDASRPRSDEPVTGQDLSAALDAVLSGAPVPADQKPSMGCSIKWKETAA